MAPAFLTRWLVPRVKEFQEKYPDVELRLSANIGPIDFRHSDTDMAVYFGNGDWDDLDVHFLRGVTLVAVCSPKLLESGHPLKDPEDLIHHTLIDVSARQDEWDRFLDYAGVSRSAVGKRMGFSSTALAMGAAMEGLGIALADAYLVEREVQYGQLVVPFDISMDTHKGFYLVYQQGRQLTYGMQSFYDWLCSEIQKEAHPEDDMK